MHVGLSTPYYTDQSSQVSLAHPLYRPSVSTMPRVSSPAGARFFPGLVAILASAACGPIDSPDRPRVLGGTWRVVNTSDFASSIVRRDVAELVLGDSSARFSDSTVFELNGRRLALDEVGMDALPPTNGTIEYAGWRIQVDSATNSAVLVLIPHGIGGTPDRYRLVQQGDTLWMQSTYVGSLSEPKSEVYRLVRVAPGTTRR